MGFLSLLLTSRLAQGALAAAIVAGALWWAWDEAGDRREAEIAAERARAQVEALHRLRQIEEETRDATDDDLRRELGVPDRLR